MPTIHTDWIDIAYEQHGDPAGRPVLLLHGFPDSVRTWDGVVRELQHDGLRLIVPDLRGYGSTKVLDDDAGGGQEVAMGQDALNLADALQLDKVTIVGQDWGARAAYAAAALAPDRVRALVTLATPYVMYEQKQPVPPPQVQAYWYQWYFNTDAGAKAFKSELVPFCRYLWKAWSPLWNFTDAEFEQAAESWHQPGFADAVLHAYRVRYGNAPQAPRYARQQKIWEGKPKLTVPAYFVAGLADACNLPEAGLGQERWFTAGHERHELAGVGHFVQRETPQFVANLIRKSLGS